MAPVIPADVAVHSNRLEVHLSASSSGPQPGTGEEPLWGCVYATAGPWRTRLMSHPTIRELVRQTQSQIISHMDTGDSYSFVHLLARLIDAVHPSHQLPAAVLSNPTYGVSILKRRLTALGYNLGPWLDDTSPLDAEHAMTVGAQIGARLAKEHRFYFEFSAPDKTAWRVGNSFLSHRA